MDFHASEEDYEELVDIFTSIFSPGRYELHFFDHENSPGHWVRAEKDGYTFKLERTLEGSVHFTYKEPLQGNQDLPDEFSEFEDYLDIEHLTRRGDDGSFDTMLVRTPYRWNEE